MSDYDGFGMSSLTAEERRLIDAAMKRGKVQRIARGATGLGEYRWNEEQQDLVAVDDRNCLSKKWRDRQRTKADRRRSTIERDLKAGRTLSQIALDWGVHESTVREDCRRLGLSVSSDGRLKILLEAPS
ncbi:hypothetical protein AAD018_013845 [Aestuariibius insulae]|uniref:hypothetical protein n=1 Tax=Aestuariibius insulae TaxID=2058287 RepID=UPI00345E4EAA